MKNTIRTLAMAATLTLNACSAPGKLDMSEIPDLTCEPVLLQPGVCVQISDGDPPVFRPCDQVDYLAGNCTFRVLDTVQVQPFEIAMTKEECLAIGNQVVGL